MDQESATRRSADGGGRRARRDADDASLLRAHEPVVRLTAGEYFVPVAVDAYVHEARLYHQGPGEVASVKAEREALTLESLAEIGRTYDGPGLSLSGTVQSGSFWSTVGSWFQTKRPSFRAGSRLAQVGLMGRSIDTLSRLSLFVRGAVPGGSAAASLALQNEHLRPDQPTYYGRVVRDGTWIVCQYWFFYSFNNWRSGFSGVNEHEADWEQVTVYLDGTGVVGGDGLPPARWVVFSAHDETRDDLRRRWDDPDLLLVDGRHPVVFAGAGSHSGAYLPGDYLITIVPPSWGGVVPTVRHLAKFFTPWTRAAQGSGLGIPYIDYARGDGPGIGPGEALGWAAAVIDDDTPWVRDYRGLWGHDTRDRLGGERGPAGPRYERDTTGRESWGDPVGWAGLAKAAPNLESEQQLITARVTRIDAEIAELEKLSETRRVELGQQAAGLGPASPQVRALEPEERRLTSTRMEIVSLRDERRRMLACVQAGGLDAGPHAHLSHRRLPISPSERGRARVLSAWSVVSTPLVVLLIAVIFDPASFNRWAISVGLIICVLAVEAFARGYFLAFWLRVLAVSVLFVLLVLFFYNWQIVAFWTLAGLAALILVVNVRDAVRR